MAHIIGGGDHVICTNITHCIRKWICDSPLKKRKYCGIFFGAPGPKTFSNRHEDIV